MIPFYLISVSLCVLGLVLGAKKTEYMFRKEFPDTKLKKNAMAGFGTYLLKICNHRSLSRSKYCGRRCDDFHNG